MTDGRKQDDKDTQDQSLDPDGSPRGAAPGQSSATDWDMNRTKPGGGPDATPDDKSEDAGTSASSGNAAGSQAGGTRVGAKRGGEPTARFSSCLFSALNEGIPNALTTHSVRRGISAPRTFRDLKNADALTGAPSPASAIVSPPHSGTTTSAPSSAIDESKSASAFSRSFKPAWRPFPHTVAFSHYCRRHRHGAVPAAVAPGRLQFGSTARSRSVRPSSFIPVGIWSEGACSSLSAPASASHAEVEMLVC